MKTIICSMCALLLSITTANATELEENEVLVVERVISNNFELAFPNVRNIKPQASDFELINYIMMTNKLGERWAVLTLQNSSSGGRTLEEKHLMALFADGERRSPLPFKLRFDSKEVQSVTVSFDENKFPILSIYSNR